MSWRTWSPFQSQRTRDICEHMTPDEERQVWTRGTRYGMWCCISLAMPVAMIMSFPSVIAFCIAGLLVVAHLVVIPTWRRKTKDLLCNTQWARSQGVSPDRMGVSG